MKGYCTLKSMHPLAVYQCEDLSACHFPVIVAYELRTKLILHILHTTVLHEAIACVDLGYQNSSVEQLATMTSTPQKSVYIAGPA